MQIFTLQRWVDRSSEAGWLAMVVLVPLAITHDTWMDAYTQVPKVFVLRTVTLFLVAALVTGAALSLGIAPWRPVAAIRAWRDAAKRHPARLVLLAVAAIVYANLLATALSPVPHVSIAGADAGRVSGGLLTFASYIVAFVAVVAHLRTRTQLMRILYAITGAAWLVSLYGIGQHFGVDWFLDDALPAKRVTLTFGNPIFAGALLTMTVPLSLALGTTLGGKSAQILVGAAMVAPQIAAAAFTLTRGTWLGLAFGCVAFLVAIGWSQDLRRAGRSAAVLGLSLGVALLLVALPVPGQTEDSNLVASRLSSIPISVSAEGGLSSRYAIWGSTIDVLRSSPWPDEQAYPAIPTLTASALRPLVGYGPDMYTYVYPLSGDTLNGGRAEYAHNFVLQAATEIGVLGASAYVGLIAALGLLLFRLLKQAKRTGEFGWRVPLLVGISASLVARTVEQMVGVAQTSDLLLSWVLAGAVVALSLSRFDCETTTTPAGSRTARSLRTSVPLMGAGLFVLVLGFAWIEVVFEDAYSARLAARAHAASEPGDAGHADELLAKAIALSPGSAVTRLGLADRLFERALVSPSPRTQAEALVSALRETDAVQARNPLDGRAWARSARINVMLDSLIEGTFAEAALEDALTLAALYPGFWQPRLEVAATRLLLDDSTRAIEDLAVARKLGAEGPSVLFAEAMALLAAGRRDEASAVANELLLDEAEAARAMHEEFLRNLGADR
ncbi:MAG: O-antigen ligase family protein [Chloroflexi bacterium]|nr:O-antigen ligase family protein [Chloroflexota bacterium]MDA1174266.1 O-antigen ligase family protein [Chloroflexota bacterium]